MSEEFSEQPQQPDKEVLNGDTAEVVSTSVEEVLQTEVQAAEDHRPDKEDNNDLSPDTVASAKQPPEPLSLRVPDGSELELPSVTVESVIEAILFASDEPLSTDRLSSIGQFNGTAKQIKDAIELLNRQYAQNGRAFRIEQIAGGFQMMTLPEYNLWLNNLLGDRSDNKLTPAALETLAIIAYKQPLIRADVEAIRGVACGEMIRSLMAKGLVKIAGKAEVLGRPILYGTTRKFLEVFGLAGLKDLPSVEELKKPAE